MIVCTENSMVTGANVPDTIYRIPREVVLSYNSKKRIGNYLIGKTIGEGAFAKVKEGMHVITGEKVAIKIIDKTKAKQDSYLWKNLKREVKLLQCMRHPNVVSLYESMETEIAYYLVLELIRGGEMKDYISKADKLSEKETKKFMRQLLSAVWHIHSAGVVHRDLKVENIMLSKSGDLKIIDFGLSNCFKSLESKGGKGTQCGSPAYAAPELLANKGYDSKVDVWAIGVNMFAMLVGKLPFKVKPFNLKKLYQKMVTGDMEPLPTGVSQEARDLLNQLLQPDPKDRITLEVCAADIWLEEQVTFIASPNFPTNEDLNQEVIVYMEEYQNVNGESLVLDLLTHNTNPSTATYHHMCKRFDRYLEQENSNKSLGDLNSPTESKKELVSPRRASKTRVVKRRPKTAISTIRRTDTQTDTASTQSSPTKPRRNSLAVGKKVERRSPVVSTPVTKQAFRVPASTPNKNGDAKQQPCRDSKTEDSGFSGSRKMSVMSTDSSKSHQSSPRSEEAQIQSQNQSNSIQNRSNSTEARSISIANRTINIANRTNEILNRTHETSNTVKGPVKTTFLSSRTYSHSNKRDGKVNWRQTSLIKTKNCLNTGISPQMMSHPAKVNSYQRRDSQTDKSLTGETYKRTNTPSPVSENILLLANSKQVPPVINGCLYGNKTARIQWPPIKDGTVNSEAEYSQGVYMSPRSLGNQSPSKSSASYKWKNDMNRASIGINKANMMARRNMSLPESVCRPQTNYRTYTYR